MREAFNQMTNSMIKGILDDPLALHPTQVISNGNAEVWYEPLSDGTRAVLLLNTSTNLSVPVGFDTRDVGYAYGAQVSLTECEFQTNVQATGTFTNTLAPMTGLLYKMGPATGNNTLAPSQSLRTPFEMFAPYNLNSFYTTEAQYIGYAQIMNTNNYMGTIPMWIRIDPGWQSTTRDGNGNLVANASLFPDGLSNTIYFMHTNNVKVMIWDMFEYTNAAYGLIGSSGPTIQNQYLAQDLSNFVFGFNVDGVDLEYTTGNGGLNRNATYSLYDGQAQGILQSLTGQSFPLISGAFDTNTTPVVPNGISAFTVAGSYDFTSPSSAWTSLLRCWAT